MMNENEKQIPVSEDFLPEEPPLAQELPPEELPAADMPELILVPGESVSETEETPVMPESFLLFPESEAETGEESPLEEAPQELPAGEEEDHSLEIPDEIFEAEDAGTEPMEDTAELPIEVILAELQHDREAGLIPPAEDLSNYPPIDEPYIDEPPAEQLQEPRYHAPRKGRPRRKGGYGLFGLPHLAATLVWLGIIVMIGTSLGRMAWVCAADVLAFGRESKQVSVTITSRDTIDDIAAKLHEADLIRYPQVFKLYAKLAVDEGDILPGTFQLDTIYDYHALVVQMGPRSSTRSVVEDLLIPEGLNCRQIFELLEQKNICTVRELEEYAATGEFSEFWFLDGLKRGDRYCLEGFLFPDTYDFYEHSTPREALGKMLLGFKARVNQEETMAALTALNERLSGMMRANGCSEAHIAENQLSLRDLLIVASLIEEETASSKESPLIASVIFNRLTEDQMYERYLNIDAAIIYATGDADNIDTSIDHPYNTYKYAGLTPGPISNPGLDSINAVLHFEDSEYYYYVLNPETDMHQFSKTLQEHEEWVEKFRGMGQ
jgi:UPF0755 protein